MPQGLFTSQGAPPDPSVREVTREEAEAIIAAEGLVAWETLMGNVNYIRADQEPPAPIRVRYRPPIIGCAPGVMTFDFDPEKKHLNTPTFELEPSKWLVWDREQQKAADSLKWVGGQ